MIPVQMPKQAGSKEILIKYWMTWYIHQTPVAALIYSSSYNAMSMWQNYSWYLNNLIVFSSVKLWRCPCRWQKFSKNRCNIPPYLTSLHWWIGQVINISTQSGESVNACRATAGQEHITKSSCDSNNALFPSFSTAPVLKGNHLDPMLHIPSPSLVFSHLLNF